jgi:hypothetical protein
VLAGTLNDVPLPDVLALLAQTSKTGSVHVVGDGRRGRIDLIGGKLGMAQPNIGRLGLVRRLVGMGALTAEQLAPGLEAAAASPDPDIQLVRSAYRAGTITAELVRAATEAHIVDAMFDLLRVEAGRFRFDPCKVAELGVQRTPQDVLDDVAARNQEWEAIRASVPAPGAIVHMLPTINQQEVVLQQSTWRLLSMVDGRRTVAELINLLGLGEYEVSQSLHRLVGEGLVAVVVGVGKRKSEEPDGVDHVLKLETELADRRADASGQLSGQLEWDTGGSVPAATKAKPKPKGGDAREEDVATADADESAEAADDPAGDGETKSSGTSEADDWADVKLPEGSEALDTDVEEPEVYTTQLGDPDADSDDDNDDDTPAPRRRTGAGSRKGTLAATTERRGRLLPEPEPGHDAEDLTRRLLEGVGKS